MSLARFFEHIAPFLRGASTVQELEANLGPSSSGSESMVFYATLIERNYAKILREIFVSVRVAADLIDPALWSRLVGEYVSRTRVVHPDPNEFGREFSHWLADRRVATASQSALLEELADYQWIRHLASHAPDSDRLGLDERVFIRHYTHPIPRVAAALWKGEGLGKVDLLKTQPTTLLIFREHAGTRLRYIVPSAIQMGVLIEAAGNPWPAALPDDDEARRVARAGLVEARVLPETNPSFPA